MRHLARSVAFLLPVIFASGCDSHAYYRQAVQYVAVSGEVLITRGLCTNSMKDPALWHNPAFERTRLQRVWLATVMAGRSVAPAMPWRWRAAQRER